MQTRASFCYQVLYRHEMAHSRYYLDAVITLVDAKHILRHLESSGPLSFTRHRPEAERQVALADRVLINKVRAHVRPSAHPARAARSLIPHSILHTLSHVAWCSEGGLGLAR